MLTLDHAERAEIIAGKERRRKRPVRLSITHI